MTIYKTIQGDTWDLIAFQKYGNAFFTPPLLEANPAYLDMVIFPAGVVLNIPELLTAYVDAANTPPWRDV